MPVQFSFSRCNRVVLLTVSSSTSTVRNIREGYFSDSSQYNGAITLQGPHHDALKFAITCWGISSSQEEENHERQLSQNNQTPIRNKTKLKETGIYASTAIVPNAGEGSTLVFYFSKNGAAFLIFFFQNKK